MLKNFSVPTLFCVSLVPFITESTFANPLLENHGYPVVPNSTVDSLVCYAQMEDGKTLDLSQLCRDREAKDQSGRKLPASYSTYAPSNSSFSSIFPGSSYAPITYSGNSYAPVTYSGNSYAPVTYSGNSYAPVK